MIQRILEPHPLLRPYVECYRYFELEAPDLGGFEVVDYPNTNTDIVFCIEGKIQILNAMGQGFTVAGSTFYGHFSTHYRVRFEGRCKMLNVRFRPSGISSITDVPLGEFRDCGAGLEQLVGPLAGEWFYRIGAAGQLSEQIVLLDQALLEKLRKGHRPRLLLSQALDLALQSKGEMPIQQLCEKLQIGYRRMHRLFHQEMGLGPKQFMKLTRFRHILSEVEQQTAPDWMQLVADYNFHDQSHLIKEFRQIAGESPTEFMRRRELQLQLSHNLLR